MGGLNSGIETVEMRRGTKTWAGRGGAVALVMLVAFVLGYAPYHVYARSGLARTLQLRRDLHGLRARNAELRADNERLSREAEALRSDPDAIERVAREELGWVLPGEVIVDFSRNPTVNAVEPARGPAMNAVEHAGGPGANAIKHVGGPGVNAVEHAGGSAR